MGIETKKFVEKVAKPLAVVGLAVGMTACGGGGEGNSEEAPRDTTTSTTQGRSETTESTTVTAMLTCQPEAGGQWTGLQPGFDSAALAEELNTTEDRLVMGVAECAEPIVIDDMMEARYVVEGIGFSCLPLGPMSDSPTPPQPGEEFTTFMTVCASAEGQPV